jgi:hypothetical protein
MVQNTQGKKLIEEFTLPLMSNEVHHLLTDPSCRALIAFPQFEAGFLFLTSCMPSTAEYVLGALLLAAELGGDGEAVKHWVRDCQENQKYPTAEWRNHLGQAYKLRCGNLLSRVKYLFQRWAHMEVTDMAIETYCTQMSKSRRVKVVNKKQRNRMMAGHDGHFEKLREHVLQIEPTHLEYLAGKTKRFGTGKKCTAGEEPPPPTEELRDLKQQVTNSTKAIVRMGNTIAEKKQIVKDFRGELKSAQLRSAAAVHEKDQQIDELHGKLQGLQFEMKKLQVANAEMHERVRKLNNDVIEAHTANIGIVDGADTLLERVSDSMSVAPRAVMPAHLARMAMELAVNGVPAKRMAAVTCSVLKAAHPPPEIARGMQHIAARELHGGGSPDWGSGAARCLWQHLLVCTRRSGILIGRGSRSGLRARLVRHTSSVPGVNGPRKAFERGKAW